MNADPAGRDYGIVTPEPVADSYIKKLKEANIIENEIFSLAYRGTADSDPSYIDIGFYDEAAMNDPSNLVWISNNNYGSYNQYYWNNDFTGFRLRPQNTDHSSTPDLTGALSYSTGHTGIGILSTGLSCLVMPSDIIDFVYQKQMAEFTANGVSYTADASWDYLFDCTEGQTYLLDMDILFGGYWIEAPLDSILIQVSGNTCGFCLSRSTSGGSLYVLGSNFFQYYYTVHDMENQRIGFAPMKETSTGILKQPLVAGSTPGCIWNDSACTGLDDGTSSNTSSGELTDADIALITNVLIAVILIGIPLFIIYWFFFKPAPSPSPSPSEPEPSPFAKPKEGTAS